jgi:hypothetical protein
MRYRRTTSALKFVRDCLHGLAVLLFGLALMLAVPAIVGGLIWLSIATADDTPASGPACHRCVDYPDEDPWAGAGR